MMSLTQREARNFQFDFLRPNHSLFPFFTKLVEQYSKIFNPPVDLKDRLMRIAHDRHDTLERCVERSEWERLQWEQKKKKDEEAEAERRTIDRVFESNNE